MDEATTQDERWQQVEEVYHAALSLTTAEREAFVANASAEDGAVCEEVMSLLEADDRSSVFLLEPAVSLGLRILASENLQDDETLIDSEQPSPLDPMIRVL